MRTRRYRQGDRGGGMSEQHTPGQLTMVTTYAQPELRDAVGKLVAIIPAYEVENARRLVACWNACEGIPTDALYGKSIDEYVSQQAFITGMNPSPEGMDLGVKGLAAQMMAASFAGQFIGNGAVNYLEMSMSHPDVGPFTVTIQRTQGLTPTQKLRQAEAQRDELLEALRDALSVLQSVSTSRDRRVVREGCILYLQTEEWCKWAEDEVGAKVRTAIAKAEGGSAE